MRFLRFASAGEQGLAIIDSAGDARGVLESAENYLGNIGEFVASGPAAFAKAAEICVGGSKIDLSTIRYLPPIARPGKIICVGLNYADHSKESGYDQPEYPAIFARFASSLIGNGEPIVRPTVSDQLDYEGELVAVIGKPGRAIPKERALEHVAGYSIFNDVSVRDFQHRTAQWTMGKNFDDTGAFGPFFVTADSLPPGCRGLHLETRLNGVVVQSAPIDDLMFDIATLVSVISASFRLESGDIIVSGTPSGVGAARKPPLWMKPGDTCEVEIKGIGILRNPVIQETSTTASAPLLPAELKS